jgi:hypothetical protein
MIADEQREELGHVHLTGVAMQVINGFDAAEVLVDRAQTLQRVTQKAQVKEHKTGRLGFRVFQMVAGNRYHAGLFSEKGGYVRGGEERIGLRTVQSDELVSESALQCVLDGAAGIFEDMVVNQNKPVGKGWDNVAPGNTSGV